jgi:hypothetical protein
MTSGLGVRPGRVSVARAGSVQQYSGAVQHQVVRSGAFNTGHPSTEVAIPAIAGAVFVVSRPSRKLADHAESVRPLAGHVGRDLRRSWGSSVCSGRGSKGSGSGPRPRYSGGPSPRRRQSPCRPAMRERRHARPRRRRRGAGCRGARRVQAIASAPRWYRGSCRHARRHAWAILMGGVVVVLHPFVASYREWY